MTPLVIARPAIPAGDGSRGSEQNVETPGHASENPVEDADVYEPDGEQSLPSSNETDDDASLPSLDSASESDDDFGSDEEDYLPPLVQVSDFRLGSKQSGARIWTQNHPQQQQ